MKYFLHKYFVRKPVKMVLTFLLMSAVSLAAFIGVQLLGSAVEVNGNINANFTTIIMPNTGAIYKL